MDLSLHVEEQNYLILQFTNLLKVQLNKITKNCSFPTEPFSILKNEL